MTVRGAASALVMLCAALLLNACAVLAPPDTGPRADPFDVLGRVLVSFDGRSFSSHVRWQHEPSFDELWLMTPTGQALAHLREDGSGATITGTDQTRYQGSRVESLTRQALGWEFPLARLQFWLRGQPVPGAKPEVIERDTTGRIVRMTQDGWRLGYEFSDAPEYEGLPRRVEAASGTQNIRLVIDSWRREPAAGDAPSGVFITR